MVMPVYGKGKLAGQPILDCQGLGISSQDRGPEGRGGVPRISAVARAAEGAAREDRLDPGQHHLRHLGHHRTRRCAPCGRPGACRRTSPMSPTWCPASSTSRRCCPTAQQVVAGQDHRRAGRRARRQGRQGVARLQSGHRRELQEVGGRPGRIGRVSAGPARSQGEPAVTGVNRRRLAPYLYVLPLVVLLAFVFGYPLVRIFEFSFKMVRGIDGPWIGLRNYELVLSPAAVLGIGPAQSAAAAGRPVHGRLVAADLDRALRARGGLEALPRHRCSCPTSWRSRSSPWS